MLLAGALGFAPVAYDIASRRPIKWTRVAKPLRHLVLFILISLLTGRRKEAILSLRWPAVDFTRATIDFRRLGEIETKKRRGRCNIPNRLLPHLRRAKRFEHDIGPVVSWNGKAIEDIQTSFTTAAERVFLEGISPHVMRHTAASWLMQAGHDPWKVADFLSMSLSTLLKVYGHHHPDHQSEIARSFGHSPQNVRAIR
jgi:integrase